MPGTAIRSLSVKSASVLTLRLRVISQTEPPPMAESPLTSLCGIVRVLSHSASTRLPFMVTPPVTRARVRAACSLRAPGQRRHERADILQLVAAKHQLGDAFGLALAQGAAGELAEFFDHVGFARKLLLAAA